MILHTIIASLYQSQCTSLFSIMHACVHSCSVVSISLQPHELELIRLLGLWDSPDNNTRVGFHSLLQRIFPTQGANSGLLHCRQILHHLNYQGSPPYYKHPEFFTYPMNTHPHSALLAFPRCLACFLFPCNQWSPTFTWNSTVYNLKTIL